MRNKEIESNPILKTSFEFSLAIIEFCDSLDDRKKFVISKQLLKSATSIGANVMEAQNAESRSDFIHKMKIAAKEADATQYWLMLCEYSGNYPTCGSYLLKLEEIQKILNKIIGSARNKALNQNNAEIGKLAN